MFFPPDHTCCEAVCLCSVHVPICRAFFTRGSVKALPGGVWACLAPVTGACAHLAPVTGACARLAPVTGTYAHLAPVTGTCACLNSVMELLDSAQEEKPLCCPLVCSQSFLGHHTSSQYPISSCAYQYLPVTITDHQLSETSLNTGSTTLLLWAP